jgi:hypothetical protein
MAKDALGHGSEAKGAHSDKVNRLPMFAHVPPVTFGKRATIPAVPFVPSHQIKLGQLVSAFAKSESGEGQVPQFMEENATDPDRISNVGEAIATGLADQRVDLSAWMHFVHFLGFLGAVAVITVLVQSVAEVL